MPQVTPIQDLLFTKFAKGEKEAGDKLFSGLYRPSISFVMKKWGLSFQDAEDVFQDAFIAVTTHKDGFSGAGFVSWFFLFLENRAKHLFGKKHGGKRLPLSSIEFSVDDQDVFSKRCPELVRRLRFALARLEPRSLEIFSVSVFQDRTYAEIAEDYGLTRGGVSGAIHDIKKILSRIIENPTCVYRVADHDLIKCFSKLSQKNKAAVSLVRFDKLSPEEAAKKLGIKPTSLKSRLLSSYARVRFELNKARTGS